MRNVILTIWFIVLLLGMGAFGDTVELPLNCEGTYDVNTPPWTTDFDLRVTFSEISNIYIRWSGTTTGELRYYRGSTYPVDGEFYIWFYKSHLTGFVGSAYIYGGADTYPVPEPFDSNTVVSHKHHDLSELLEGQASVEVGFHMLGGYEFEETLIYPIGQLDSATLIFEGTIVPEPASLVLFALAGLFLKKRQLS